jgi:hypothetical protein
VHEFFARLSLLNQQKTQCQFFNKMKKILVSILLAVSAAFVSSRALATDALFYKSPAESIFGETYRTIERNSEARFFAYSNGKGVDFDAMVDSTREIWTFSFKAPNDDLINVGEKYFFSNLVSTEAWEIWNGVTFDQPVGILSHHVNDIVGDVYPEIVSGGFTILELEYNPVNWTVTSFAVNFQFFENVEGLGDKWLYGSIRINSDIPLSNGGGEIPEPSTYAGVAGISIFGFALARRKARQMNSV